MTTRELILSKLDQIPRLPPAAVQAFRVLQDPDSSLEDVVPTLAHDPGLTAELLRLANSAAFASRFPCTTLKDAIVRLGKDNVRMVVVKAGLGPAAEQPLAAYGLGPGELLEHSMLVARATTQLAKVLKLDAPPSVFTAGLLHNIGKLVLGTWCQVDGTKIAKLAKLDVLSFDAAERELLRIDHAEVGAVLLERWGIPEEIVTAVRWHHQPEQCPHDRLGARLIHIADCLCIRHGIGAGVDGEFYPPNTETEQALGYEPETGDKLLRALQADRNRIVELFGFTKKELAVELPPEEDTPRRPAKSGGLLGFLNPRRKAG